jgi:class 3 adenylate cyclase
MSVALIGLALLGAVIGLVVVFRRLAAQRAETGRIRAIFSRYVASGIVDEILERKDPRIFEGRSTYATIIVCRIWNFAHLSENLTPEETLRYLNEFYTLAGKSIQKHRGMIESFLTDGIVGVFGVPIDEPRKEEHAIRASIDIVRLMSAMETRWAAQGRKAIRVGIGINSGNVIAGDVGFAERREYTVIGNEVLVASRLQEATNDINAYILASAATCEPVTELFSLLPAQRIPLRGMRKLPEAFIVRGLARGDDPLLLPNPNVFKRTTIVPDQAEPAAASAPAVEPAAQPAATAAPTSTIAPATAPAAATAPVAPRLIARPVPDEPPVGDFPIATLRPRRRPGAAGTGDYSGPIDPPELRMPRFAAFDDEGAIMPEPPPPRAVYEDKDGPPLQLPP